MSRCQGSNLRVECGYVEPKGEAEQSIPLEIGCACGVTIALQVISLAHRSRDVI